MGQALTLTEAAERLAPVFDEPEAFSAPVESRQNSKWMSLENAASVLAGRVNGQHVAPRKQRAEVTVQDAARQIAARDTPEELAEIRERRTTATAAKWQRLSELQEYTKFAGITFEGMDETAALASPEFMVVYGNAQQLKAQYEAALREEFDLWETQCREENSVFETNRPDWSPDHARRVVEMLLSFGMPDQDIMQLWFTPAPINTESPICQTLANMATGIEGPEAMGAALGSVGFHDDEIQAALSGQMPVYLRDHRIQELVARAADADTQAKNRAAA